MVSNGSRPLIGLTSYVERARCLVWDTDFALLPHGYVDAVASAGGVPVLLPEAEHGADRVVALLDGLVLSGGPDVDPARYGGEPHPRTHGTRARRDRWEAQLLALALGRDLPVLGVCRGAQLLNIELGGSLVQHLPDVVGHDEHRPAPGRFGSTAVRLGGGSRLARILGDEAKVPCHHHQGFARVAPDLEPVGWATDGTVEAVESLRHGFVVGVQWHPEAEPGDRRVFEALVEAAARRCEEAAR